MTFEVQRDSDGDDVLGGSKVLSPIPFGNISVFNQIPLTFVDGDVDVSLNTINITGLNFIENMALQMTSSGTLPAGLSLVTTYYVVNLDLSAETMEVSLTEGGIPVDITAAAGGGTHTISPYWVVPAGVTRIFAEVYGGGGGGGGGNAISDVAGGGASGGMVLGFITVVPGIAMAVVVGAGGLGNTAGQGNTGSTSTFSSFTGGGGGGGEGNAILAHGGTGTASSGGDINTSGGSGHGSARGTEVFGGQGGENKMAVGGLGGVGDTDDGLDGGLFGGGGGGASGNGDGGNGGDGGVIIWF